jgi:hypothetical protein
VRTGPREGKELRCPFCRTELARPEEISIGPGEKALGGTCACGAFYLMDPTGKNAGEIMAQALGMAAEALAKNLSELQAGDDYEDVILSYDWRTHRSSGESTGYMDGYGRLYLIKPNKKTSR